MPFHHRHTCPPALSFGLALARKLSCTCAFTLLRPASCGRDGTGLQFVSGGVFPYHQHFHGRPASRLALSARLGTGGRYSPSPLNPALSPNGLPFSGPDSGCCPLPVSARIFVNDVIFKVQTWVCPPGHSNLHPIVPQKSKAVYGTLVL